jgi:hypothetical protein
MFAAGGGEGSGGTAIVVSYVAVLTLVVTEDAEQES